MLLKERERGKKKDENELLRERMTREIIGGVKRARVGKGNRAAERGKDLD